jgi:hypothetical protein
MTVSAVTCRLCPRLDKVTPMLHGALLSCALARNHLSPKKDSNVFHTRL